MISIFKIGNSLAVQDGGKAYHIKQKGGYFTLKDYIHKGRKPLRNRSIVIGIVGPRGSGKSVNGARLAILDFFLKGITNVWSNMDIGFNLIQKDGKVIPVHSQPIDKMTLTDLDEVYRDGLIFFDEVNMAIADSRRSTSRGTLQFDYVVQQLRKRRLNVIWTAQSEDQVEIRLRSQTDIFLKCADLSLTNPKCDIGHFSHIKCYDYAGMINAELPSKTFDGVFHTAKVWNQPWWNSYSTWQLQGIEEEKKATAEETERMEMIDELEGYIRANAPVKKNILWATYRIRDSSTKNFISRRLGERGIVSNDNNRIFLLEEQLIA